MSERATFAILAVLAIIAIASVVLAYLNAGDSEAVQILRDMAIGLVGALGGGAAIRASRRGGNDEGEG